MIADGEKTPRNSAKDPIRFVSDVHVKYGDREYLELFLAFLRATRGAADRLLIVGDLFEFWIGDHQGRLDFYRPLWDGIRELVASGTRVGMIRGNRDFMIDRAFEDAGAELLPDEVWLDLGGRSIHVSHGDELCINDTSYQAARVVMRSSGFRGILNRLPVFFGLQAARRYRRISEKKHRRWKAKNDGHRFGTIADGVDRLARNGDPDVVICGHIHFRARQILAIAGHNREIITTGAWEEEPNYVRFDGKEFVSAAFAAQ